MKKKFGEVLLKNKSNTLCVVLCTFPDYTYASTMAERLVIDQFAGCITLLPNVTSFYYWEGTLEKRMEVQLQIKTSMSLKDKLFTYIKSYHPDQIPELLVLPVVGGDPSYLSWLNAPFK